MCEFLISANRDQVLLDNQQERTSLGTQQTMIQCITITMIHHSSPLLLKEVLFLPNRDCLVVNLRGSTHKNASSPKPKLPLRPQPCLISLTTTNTKNQCRRATTVTRRKGRCTPTINKIINRAISKGMLITK